MLNKREFLISAGAAFAAPCAAAAAEKRPVQKYRALIGGRTLASKRPLPAEYQWLEAPSTPGHLKIAMAEFGRTQITDVHAPFIDEWVKELGCSPDDSQAFWCGVFAGIVVKRAGFAPPKLLPRAAKWETFGEPVKPGQERIGDIVVLNRESEGKGHIGFYVGQDDTHFHLLGGNQGDGGVEYKVSIKQFVRDVHRFSRRVTK